MTLLVYSACGFTLGISVILCINGLKYIPLGDLSQFLAGLTGVLVSILALVVYERYKFKDTHEL